MIEKLQKIGLSRKESEIYLALAKKDNATANELAKETSTNRTVCYNTLQQLVEKGIISYSTKNNVREFTIGNPKSLLSDIYEKEEIAKDIIKELENIKKEDKNTRKVEIFEGINGLKKIFDEIRESKELDVINATGLIFENLKFSAKHIIKDIDRSDRVRIIGTESMKRTELSRMIKGQIKYLPKSAENFATTFIFDGRVIIQTLKNKPFLIKISERSIYEGYKKDFDVLWERL